MANEATLYVQTGLPINMTCADGTGIEKGAILAMSDPLTAATSSAANDIVAGIAAAEKIASDGVTKLPVWREGIFKVTLSGSCTAGDALSTDISPNHVAAVGSYATLSGSVIIGTALETGTTGQTILMELKPYAVTGSQ